MAITAWNTGTGAWDKARRSISRPFPWKLVGVFLLLGLIGDHAASHPVDVANQCVRVQFSFPTAHKHISDQHREVHLVLGEPHVDLLCEYLNMLHPNLQAERVEDWLHVRNVEENTMLPIYIPSFWLDGNLGTLEQFIAFIIRACGPAAFSGFRGAIFLRQVEPSGSTLQIPACPWNTDFFQAHAAVLLQDSLLSRERSEILRRNVSAAAAEAGIRTLSDDDQNPGSLSQLLEGSSKVDWETLVESIRLPKYIPLLSPAPGWPRTGRLSFGKRLTPHDARRVSGYSDIGPLLEFIERTYPSIEAQMVSSGASRVMTRTKLVKPLPRLLEMSRLTGRPIKSWLRLQNIFSSTYFTLYVPDLFADNNGEQLQRLISFVNDDGDLVNTRLRSSLLAVEPEDETGFPLTGSSFPWDRIRLQYEDFLEVIRETGRSAQLKRLRVLKTYNALFRSLAHPSPADLAERGYPHSWYLRKLLAFHKLEGNPTADLERALLEWEGDYSDSDDSDEASSSSSGGEED